MHGWMDGWMDGWCNVRWGQGLGKQSEGFPDERVI